MCINVKCRVEFILTADVTRSEVNGASWSMVAMAMFTIMASKENREQMKRRLMRSVSGQTEISCLFQSYGDVAFCIPVQK